MTQYNTLNVKLSNSQLIKLQFAITNGTELTNIFHETLSEVHMMKLTLHINYY